MNGYEKINITDGINLMLIPKENFKTDIVTIYLKRQLSREEATKNSLLPSVLKSAVRGYDSPIKISKRLQELYGTNIGVSTDKMGERQVMSFRMYAAADMFLPENIFEDAFDMLRETVFDPYITESGFVKQYVDIEKQNLKEDILAKINNKAHYALERCIETMCESEPYSISEDGYIEDLDSIDEKNLFEHYKQVIKTSPIDIVVAGSFDKDKIVEAVKRMIQIEDYKPVQVKDEEIYKIPETRYVSEAMDVAQGKLVMGFRTNTAYSDENYYSLLMYSVVLGGGAHSKLFNNIREKHSLCYSIHSSLEKLKGLMFISAGIEIQNYDRTLKLINAELEDMKNAVITDEELSNSKSYITNNLRSLNDSLSSLIDFYYSMSLQSNNRTLEEIIAIINDITIDQIQDISKNIYLDTVYFLTGISAPADTI